MPPVKITRFQFDTTGFALGDILVADGAGSVDLYPPSSLPGGGHVVADEGTPVTQRGTLNFTGDGVSVSDDSGNDESDVSIPSMIAGTVGSVDISGGVAALTGEKIVVLTNGTQLTDITNGIANQLAVLVNITASSIFVYRGNNILLSKLFYEMKPNTALIMVFYNGSWMDLGSTGGSPSALKIFSAKNFR